MTKISFISDSVTQFLLRTFTGNRQHKYDEDLKCSCTDEYRGYMKGWYCAYQDIKEILEQSGFDTSQLLIHRVFRTRQK